MTCCPIPTKEPYAPHVAAQRNDDAYLDGFADGASEVLRSDLTSCAYFMRQYGGDPRGICSFGCQEEPACVTSQPKGGWPEQRRIERAVGVALNAAGIS